MSDKPEDDPMIKPGGVLDFTLAALVLLFFGGIVIGLLWFAVSTYDPSAPKGPLPWSW